MKVKEENKELTRVKNIKAYCIYEGDDFETEYDIATATLKITKFNPKFENIDITRIKGAFAVVLDEKGPSHVEIINISQMINSWNKGYDKGPFVAHKSFIDEIAKEIVIRRACRVLADTSYDSDLLIEDLNNGDEKIDEKSNENGFKETVDMGDPGF